MAKKTIFAGLQVLAADESLSTDNAAFTSRDREEIDRGLNIGIKTHRHDAAAGLLDPVATPSGAIIASGGTIAGGLGISLGYTLEDLDGGETLLSPVELVTTPGPLEIPIVAPTGEFSSAAGTLTIDTYSYALTYTDGEGGETPVGPSVTIDRPPGFANGQIKLAGLDAGLAEAEATGWRLYRARGGNPYVLLTTGELGESTFTDDGAVEPDCDTHPPTDNINTTNQINQLKITIPTDGIITDATFINFYASLTGEFGESSLLEQYPVSSAGDSDIFGSLEFSAQQPPDVNRSYGGAPQIDPDTELIDFHWKRPVETVEKLPTEEEGTEEGDIRAILGAEEPTIYIFLNGEWQLLELGGGGGINIVSQPAYIYWADGTAGTIGRANIDGTEPNNEFITVPTVPKYVVANDTHIFWTDETSDTIGRANIDGSEPNNEFITTPDAPIGIALDGTYVYWADNKLAIGRAKLDGSEAEKEFIKVGETINLRGLVVDAEHIYWTNTQSENIGRANIDGTEPNDNFITEVGGFPGGITVDGTHIFWTRGGEIGRANIDGSGQENEFFTTPVVAEGVTVDSAYLYWSDKNKEQIGRANLDGSEPDIAFIVGLSANTVGVDAPLSTVEASALEFLGSGSTTVTATGSGTVQVTIFSPATYPDVTASGTTVADFEELILVGSGGVLVKAPTEPEAGVADVVIEGPHALLANEGMGIILHGAVASTPRPNRFAQYTWFGSVEPENMAEFDIWIETE